MAHMDKADYKKMAESLIDLRIKLVRSAYSQIISNLRGSDIFILNYLETHKDPVHPKELSSAMSVSTARITSILNKLEENGEIRRCIDPHDKRQLIVALTDKGQERTRKNREELLPNTISFLEYLGPEDAAAYLRIEEALWDLYLNKK